MTIRIKNGSLDTTISRRGFVAGAASLTFAFTLGGIGRGGEALGATQPTKFNAFVSIGSDNTITVMCPSAEMGQGVYTSLPLILAEELDADWKKVKVVQAALDTKKYERQLTGGSGAIPHSWERLRKAGATARQMLIEAAAKRWNVSASALSTENGKVIDK